MFRPSIDQFLLLQPSEVYHIKTKQKGQFCIVLTLKPRQDKTRRDLTTSATAMSVLHRMFTYVLQNPPYCIKNNLNIIRLVRITFSFLDVQLHSFSGIQHHHWYCAFPYNCYDPYKRVHKNFFSRLGLIISVANSSLVAFFRGSSGKSSPNSGW